MAFSALARTQMTDPLAAASQGGSARRDSPVRAILGPGTGPLAAPNGALQDPTDDEMSSVAQEEVDARQHFLDTAASEFLAATGTHVFTETGEELYTDGTSRPVTAASQPAPEGIDSWTGRAAAFAPPERGPSTQHYNIGSDADEGGAETPSVTRKRTSDTARTGRSTSPRHASADDEFRAMPDLMDGCVSTRDAPHTGPYVS